jgi:hypothetical protein
VKMGFHGFLLGYLYATQRFRDEREACISNNS